MEIIKNNPEQSGKKSRKQSEVEYLNEEEKQAYKKFLSIALPWIIKQHERGDWIFDNEYSYQSFKDKLEEKIAELLKKQEKVNILNIGAGRQLLEREIMSKLKEANLKDRVNIAPMDIINANEYSKNSLLPWTVVADAVETPFKNKAFDIVVSEMAIDVLPLLALKESFRVLKPGGSIIFHFHWWSQIDEDLPSEVTEYLEKYSIGGKNNNEERIKEKLEKVGFEKVRVQAQGVYAEMQEIHWLEITGKKPLAEIK